MVTCTRCCLHTAMRIVNMVTTLLGIGIIIYSLWLLNEWRSGIAQLPTVGYPPRPWFMYTCLCMGMAVCLITICGQRIRNCVSNSTLCIYIVSITCLLLLQVAVIVTIFYKINWYKKIDEFIDKDHQKFKNFLMLHLTIIRLTLLVILVPQIKVVILAIAIWVIGSAEPTTHSHLPETPRFTQSFLVGSISDLPNFSSQTCSKCDSFYVTNVYGTFSSQFRRLFRMPFRRRLVLS